MILISRNNFRNSTCFTYILFYLINLFWLSNTAHLNDGWVMQHLASNNFRMNSTIFKNYTDIIKALSDQSTSFDRHRKRMELGKDGKLLYNVNYLWCATIFGLSNNCTSIVHDQIFRIVTLHLPIKKSYHICNLGISCCVGPQNRDSYLATLTVP